MPVRDGERAALVASLRRQRWIGLAAFGVFTALALLPVPPGPGAELPPGLLPALVASYAAALAVGQGLLRRLEGRVAAGLDLGAAEGEYRRILLVENALLALLFIALLVARMPGGPGP